MLLCAAYTKMAFTGMVTQMVYQDIFSHHPNDRAVRVGMPFTTKDSQMLMKALFRAMVRTPADDDGAVVARPLSRVNHPDWSSR